MKKASLLLLIMGLTIASTQAQLKDALSKAGVSTPNAGSLLTQFAGAIKPTSFLSGWASGGKTKWLSAAGKVSDAVSMAKSVSSPSGVTKPDMFTEGFNTANHAQAANTAQTYYHASAD